MSHSSSLRKQTAFVYSLKLFSPLSVFPPSLTCLDEAGLLDLDLDRALSLLECAERSLCNSQWRCPAVTARTASRWPVLSPQHDLAIQHPERCLLLPSHCRL